MEPLTRIPTCAACHQRAAKLFVADLFVCGECWIERDQRVKEAMRKTILRESE